MSTTLKLSARKIVFSKGKADVWSHIAGVVAESFGLEFSEEIAPDITAINIGFPDFFKSIKSFVYEPGKNHGYIIQEIPEGGFIVTGTDKFSICHAVLYLIDILKFKLFANAELISIKNAARFKRLDIAFDDYTCGFSRNADGFDLETHVRDLARTGIQTFEINQLYDDVPIQVRERLVWQDKYQWWTFYMPALDMFFESDLNRGTYSMSVLNRNRSRMHRAAEVARNYGMKPIFVTFEPRAWPERLYAKYPELRGARVDMPTYSAEAEYAPDPNHPLVQEHYRQMMCKLMQEIPDLELIEIWSQDSCAGFPWSKRLYTGENGPVLLRKHAPEIGVVNFMTVLRDEGRKVNPTLRLNINLSWFPPDEQEAIMKKLPQDIEVAATENPTDMYRPFTPGIVDDNYNIQRVARDWKVLESCRKNGRELNVQFEEVSNPWKPLGPLQGFPYPYAAGEMLQSVTAQKVNSFVIRGGLTTEAFVPNFINNEVIRAFQYDGADFDLDSLLRNRAASWTASDEEAGLLLKAWRDCDGIYRRYNSTYWTVSMFVSARTLFRRMVRPLVPNPNILDQQEIRFYRPMEFLVGESDPAWFDCFSYSYGQMITDDEAVERIKLCDLLLERANRLAQELDSSGIEFSPTLKDIRLRLSGFICMTETDRSVLAVQKAIHDCQKLKDESLVDARGKLREAILREIENTRCFICLLKETEDSKTIFTVSSGEDNVYMLRAPLSHQLKLKMNVMQSHVDDDVDRMEHLI